MTSRTIPPFRADHVGSFLRPPELLAARDRFAKGEMTRAALRAVEDDAIRDIVRFQEDAGLTGITERAIPLMCNPCARRRSRND